MDRVKTALENASQTKALLLGKGVIAGIGQLFKEQFPGKRAVIIADTTTWRVAGEQVHALLAAAGIAQDEPYIFGEP